MLASAIIAAWLSALADRTHGHIRSLVTSVAVGSGVCITLAAVQTAISQFSTLAIAEFKLDSAAIVKLVLLVQFVAMPGALAMGWLSARWSRGWSLALCLAGFIASLVFSPAYAASGSPRSCSSADGCWHEQSRTGYSLSMTATG
jgi:MFS-type transporter involved in bile tolerance (Atg22 family)